MCRGELSVVIAWLMSSVCEVSINFNQLQKENKGEIERSDGLVGCIQTVYVFRKLLDPNEPAREKLDFA